MCIEAVISGDQVDIIVMLAEEIWNEHFTPIIGKAQVDYMLAKFQSREAIGEQIKQGYSYFLIKSNNEYVGYFGVKPEAASLLLSKFYIVSADRGKGLGRKALNYIERLVIESGAGKISLTVNKYNSDTIEAYKKLGFKITESIVQDIGNGFVMDDYRMEKDF
jgi:GNAT superfamily N-acetyltransferase